MALITFTMWYNHQHHLFPKLFITPGRKLFLPAIPNWEAESQLLAPRWVIWKNHTGFKNSSLFLWHLLSLWWVWVCKTNTWKAVAFIRAAKPAWGGATKRDGYPYCCACIVYWQSSLCLPRQVLFTGFLPQQQSAWHAQCLPPEGVVLVLPRACISCSSRRG